MKPKEKCVKCGSTKIKKSKRTFWGKKVNSKECLDCLFVNMTEIVDN